MLIKFLSSSTEIPRLFHTYVSFFFSFIYSFFSYLFPFPLFSVLSFTFSFPSTFLFYLDFLLSFLPSTSHLAFFISPSHFQWFLFISLTILLYFFFLFFFSLLPFHGRTSYLFVYFSFIYVNMISYDNTNWLWSLNKTLTLSSSKHFHPIKVKRKNQWFETFGPFLLLWEVQIQFTWNKLSLVWQRITGM